MSLLQGIESLVPFITKSRLSLTLDDLVLVLKEPNPLSVHLAPATQEALSLLGKCRSTCIQLVYGDSGVCIQVLVQLSSIMSQMILSR